MASKEVKSGMREILVTYEPKLEWARHVRHTLKELEKSARESGREEILDNIYDYIPEPSGLEL